MSRTTRPVVDNEAQHRFETPIDGEAIAAAYYRIDDNARVVLIHTEVPSEYGGQGFATALATGVFDLIRQGRAESRAQLLVHGRLLPEASGICGHRRWLNGYPVRFARAA